MDNNFSNDILQVCRTCLKEITDVPFFYLDSTPTANTRLTIRGKLYSCIPEVDLSIVLNPVICGKCVDKLLSVYEFKRNCLQSEIQINKYIQQIQHNGNLDLVEVIRFQQSDIKNIELKIEDYEIIEDLKNEDLACYTSAFNEISECTESTEPRYLLKPEKADMQYVPFNRFDDYNINYHLSEAEENSDARHNSNIVQNCLPEVIEHKDSYNKNTNKTHAYYDCYKCGHRKIVSKRLSRYYKNGCYYRCSLCNYLTKYKCLFDFHNRIHLTKRNGKHIFKYTMSKINKTNIKSNKRKCVTTNNSYDKHIFLNQNKSKEFKQHSSHCNSLKPNMRIHMLVQKSYKCSVCEYQCNWKVNLKRHMQLHTREKPFLCSVCKYQCNRKWCLNRHMLIHTGEKRFSCSVCKRQFSQKSTLKQHILIHTKEKPFSCSACKYQCSRRSDLKQHIRIHTGEKPFSCSVCEYRCSSKSNLKQHIRIHTGEKPFSCSFCEYQCSRESHLKEHILIHTGEKPFKCSICKYQCSRESNLKLHILIHTGEKPFSCSFCKYQCNRKSNLKQHILIHTGEKPFSCFVCEFQCSHKSDLRKHILIHTGEKPFSCSICEYQCKQKTHLNRHMRTHT